MSEALAGEVRVLLCACSCRCSAMLTTQLGARLHGHICTCCRMMFMTCLGGLLGSMHACQGWAEAAPHCPAAKPRQCAPLDLTRCGHASAAAALRCEPACCDRLPIPEA